MLAPVALEAALTYAHETELDACNMGSDTCDTRPLVDKLCAVFLAAQDRGALLQDAANAAWPTVRGLCQHEHTNMAFGDLVEITKAVIACLLGDEIDTDPDWSTR